MKIYNAYKSESEAVKHVNSVLLAMKLHLIKEHER